MKTEVREFAVEDQICIDPAKTALVVIDLQNDFVRERGSLLVPDAEATAQLRDEYRAAGVVVNDVTVAVPDG